jgi:hypothetical protein
MSVKTNFRQIQRLQPRKDIVIDRQASELHDRILKLRGGKWQAPTPDEMGISIKVWNKLSHSARDRERTNYFAALRIKAMTDLEFAQDLKEARQDLGM